MAEIYFVDAQGKRVAVEVTEEIATQYRESLREEWRGDSYEKYHARSLDEITEAGHDFADERSNTEELLAEQEEKHERKAMLKKLQKAMPQLTELQRRTLHKIFYLNMTQADIAREEGVSEQAVSDRISHLYAKIKKLIKKF